MPSPSQPPRPDFWLEPLDIANHVQDFHEIYSDEQAALWSSQRHTDTFAASADRMSKAFAHDPEKPWLVSCAVMSSNYSPPDTGNAIGTTKMIGVVKTTRASKWGLSIGYKLRSDCWGRGYATRAVGAFLDVYWSCPRRAPRGEVYVSPTQESGESSATAAAVSGKATPVKDKDATTEEVVAGGEDDMEIEITHLVAQVDPKNVGSMRVAEKCGGKALTVEKGCVKVWRFPEPRDMAVWRLDKPSSDAPSA